MREEILRVAWWNRTGLLGGKGLFHIKTAWSGTNDNVRDVKDGGDEEEAMKALANCHVASVE